MDFDRYTMALLREPPGPTFLDPGSANSRQRRFTVTVGASLMSRTRSRCRGALRPAAFVPHSSREERGTSRNEGTAGKQINSELSGSIRASRQVARVGLGHSQGGDTGSNPVGTTHSFLGGECLCPRRALPLWVTTQASVASATTSSNDNCRPSSRRRPNSASPRT
jgi:hypothetical protein